MCYRCPGSRTGTIADRGPLPWAPARAIGHMEQQIVNAITIAAGILIVVAATGLAIRTFMIPAGAPPLINRVIFRFTQAVFDAVTRLWRSDERKHAVLTLYAPISLLAVLATLLVLIGLGYTLALYGLGVTPFIRAFLFSASALSTLGFESPGNNFWVIMLSAIEAITMATIVALLIGYLPGIYSSYQQREQAVANLSHLTGPNPDGTKVLDAYVEVFGPGKLGDLWQTWFDWFVDLRTSGSTLSGELYLRSSRWDRSWITTAGAVLDAASLADSSLDLTSDPAADRLVQFGAHTLNLVLEPLRLHCPPAATWPATAINVGRDEFAEAYEHLRQRGLPMKPDRDAAWKAFASLRVQYECALMALVRLKKPPRGCRWTTDREEAGQPLSLPVFTPRAVRATSKDPPAAAGH